MSCCFRFLFNSIRSRYAVLKRLWCRHPYSCSCVAECAHSGIVTSLLPATGWITVTLQKSKLVILLSALAIMVPLPTFQLPLPSHGPPSGYGWSDCALSDLSTTTVFNTGLDNRGKFLGAPRCIVCGYPWPLEHCHVIMQSQEFVVSRKGI
ncbi:hypothetical protein BJV74DRAFT_451453 [Russula compacta]|nr:hypothetical protein BJV74DRAFT_451453 [Russula compacta]